jgi:hypothetical protein
MTDSTTPRTRMPHGYLRISASSGLALGTTKGFALRP